MINKSIILLSGGLDSLVSLGLTKEEYNISLALTFDYGQKAALKEIEASSSICKFYNIEHKIIKLDWLKDVTHTALVKGELPQGIQTTSDSVWVPNRNGLFLNIAAAISDGENYNHIIIGANKEEGETFPDNTIEFITGINNTFKYSTKNKVKVVAPLINYDKNDIVKQAIKYNIPLNLVYSCYDNQEKNCGKCESCTRLKNALIANNATEIIREIYENNIC